MMNKFSFFEKFIFPVSLLISIATFLASLAPYLNPQQSWLIAMLGLGFPYAFVVNFFFLIFWIVKKKKTVVFSLIPFLTGIYTFFNFFPSFFSVKNNNTDEKTNLKIMSFNARVFDLYNWTGNYTGTSKTRELIFEMIKNEAPDIICFQEFYSCDTGKYQTIKTMLQDVGMKYSYIYLPISLYKVDHWGMAIFSNYELINKGKMDFKRKSSNMVLYADAVVGYDTLRVYNCHFKSIHFGQQEYKFVNEIGYNIEEENVSGAKTIIKRLKIAFTKRAAQVDTATAHIKSSPYPVIVCGDFNDTPSSFTYRAVGEGLCDAFRESGKGLGTTYTGPFPAFRIDYILHSPALSSSDFKVLNEQKLSDHYPVECNLQIHQKAASIQP